MFAGQVLVAKDRAQKLVDVIAVEKGLAEEKLAAAKPALDEAEAALNTIKPAHIGIITSTWNILTLVSSKEVVLLWSLSLFNLVWIVLGI